MQNGQFTEEEIEYLSSLDAVEGVRQNQIIYSSEFKKDFIEKYKQGKKPGKIFEEAGLSRTIIGSKRIERAAARWKEADFKGILGEVPASSVRHENKIERLKQEKSEAIKKQREIRYREVGKLNDQIERLKQRIEAKNEKIDNLDKIIQMQKSEIKHLKHCIKLQKDKGTSLSKQELEML